MHNRSIPTTPTTKTMTMKKKEKKKTNETTKWRCSVLPMIHPTKAALSLLLYDEQTSK